MNTQSLAELAAQIKSESPALNGRIERAVAIVESGGVKRFYNAWSVASQSEPGVRYAVWFDLEWKCCCKDYHGDGYHPAPTVEFMGGTQATCKHIVAAGLKWVIGE